MQRSATTSLMIFVLTATAIINALTVTWMLLTRPFFNSDFLAFWSFPRFLATHPAGQIYNAAALMAFQHQLYTGFQSFYPLTYPPTFLAVTRWLGGLSYGAAESLWTFAGLAALWGASVLFFSKSGPRLAMLASPASDAGSR